MKKTYITAGILVVLLIAGMMIYVASIPRWSVDQLIIDRATTFITGPLDAEGYPDYAAAFNAEQSIGVTPQNNAVVLLLQAIEIPPEHVESKNQVCEALGLTPTNASGRWESWFALDERTKKNALVDDAQEDANDKYTVAFGRPWAADRLPDVAQWLQDQAPALSLTIRASHRPKYYVPQSETSLAGPSRSFSMFVLNGVREMTSTLRMRAMLRIAEGNADGAWDDLQACRRLSRLIGLNDSYWNVIGCSIEYEAMEGQWILMEHIEPDDEQSRRWKLDLASLGGRPRLLPSNLDRGARLAVLEDICHTAQGLLKHGRFAGEARLSDTAIQRINWNVPLQTANVWFDRAVVAVSLNDTKLRGAALFQLAQEQYDLQTEPLPTNFGWHFESQRQADEFLSQLFLASMFPYLISVDNCESRSRTYADLTLIALALLEYKTLHGEYPEDLKQLVPERLPKIPLDHFTGTALKYQRSKNGYKLYSFGPNGLDNRGDDSQTDDADDVTVNVPFKKPKTYAEQRAEERAAQALLDAANAESNVPAEDAPAATTEN